MPLAGITCVLGYWHILASPYVEASRSKAAATDLFHTHALYGSTSPPPGSLLNADPGTAQGSDRPSQLSRLKQDGEPDALLEEESGDRPPKVPPIRPEVPLGNTNIILQVEGVLEAGDRILPSDNSLYDEHAFEGRVGQPIIITLESNDFDTYLVLVSPDQRPLNESDDVSLQNSNSSMTTILPSDGTYLAIANAFDSTGAGTYTLTVREIVRSPHPQDESD